MDKENSSLSIYIVQGLIIAIVWTGTITSY